MTAEAFKARIREIGVTQRELAREWGFAEGTVSKWANGKLPVPLMAAYALDGYVAIKMEEAARLAGYPWPPIGYSA